MVQEVKVSKPFFFKQFEIKQDQCLMKVGTDGVLLGAWAATQDTKHLLDIGTGTGLISIMLAQRSTEAQVDAVEIDEHACQQAQENIAASPWANRITAFPEAIQDFARSSTTKYDLIVSNPPFFSGGTFSNNQKRANVRHTVKLPHGELLIAVRSLLAKTGKFCVILPFIEGLRFEEIAKTYNLYCTRKTEVHPKKDKSIERLLLQFERSEQTCVVNQLIIQKEARNDWTDDYIALTKDFYLKM